MRVYVITTGVIFGLLTIAHLVRIVLERRLVPDPIFILFTLLSAGLTIWAWTVLRSWKRGFVVRFRKGQERRQHHGEIRRPEGFESGSVGCHRHYRCRANHRHSRCPHSCATDCFSLADPDSCVINTLARSVFASGSNDSGCYRRKMVGDGQRQ